MQNYIEKAIALTIEYFEMYNVTMPTSMIKFNVQSWADRTSIVDIYQLAAMAITGPCRACVTWQEVKDTTELYFPKDIYGRR